MLPVRSVGMGVDTFGMPNALPRNAEPDEHRIQISDVFSTSHGRHTFKFGGDINLVHEVMINLFQGGGIYSYGDSTNLLKFQYWIQDAFAGQAGDTDPYAGYHYSTLVQTVDQVNKTPGTQGKDDFWMKMYDGFAEDTWKLAHNFTVTAGVRYDIQLDAESGSGQPPVRSDLVGVYELDQERVWTVFSRASPSHGRRLTAPWFAAVTGCSPRSTRAAPTTQCAWKMAWCS